MHWAVALVISRIVIKSVDTVGARAGEVSSPRAILGDLLTRTPHILVIPFTTGTVAEVRIVQAVGIIALSAISCCVQTPSTIRCTRVTVVCQVVVVSIPAVYQICTHIIRNIVVLDVLMLASTFTIGQGVGWVALNAITCQG